MSGAVPAGPNGKPFRPMLAYDAPIEFYQDLLMVRWLWASPKMDGIRAVVLDGKVRSRSMKLIPNRYVQETFGIPELEGLDGELIVGAPFGDHVFARTSSGVMSRDGEPDVRFYVFDYAKDPTIPFGKRLDKVRQMLEPADRDFPIVNTEQKVVKLPQELAEYEAECLTMGYEGLIIKTGSGLYKQGRSTLREASMGKLKRFSDGEAVVIGFQEKLINGNLPTVSERGYQVRSTHKDGMIPADTLGAFEVMDVKRPDWRFNVGSGLDDQTRQEIWNNKNKYLGKTLCYKYLSIGTEELPRHPVFKGWRAALDMS